MVREILGPTELCVLVELEIGIDDGSPLQLVRIADVLELKPPPRLNEDLAKCADANHDRFVELQDCVAAYIESNQLVMKPSTKLIALRALSARLKPDGGTEA